jgi:hypothetical protein
MDLLHYREKIDLLRSHREIWYGLTRQARFFMVEEEDDRMFIIQPSTVMLPRRGQVLEQKLVRLIPTEGSIAKRFIIRFHLRRIKICLRKLLSCLQYSV